MLCVWARDGSQSLVRATRVSISLLLRRRAVVKRDDGDGWFWTFVHWDLVLWADGVLEGKVGEGSLNFGEVICGSLVWWLLEWITPDSVPRLTRLSPEQAFPDYCQLLPLFGSCKALQAGYV
jgi:hypothetical protein